MDDCRYTVRNKYIIGATLGQGKFGIVFECMDIKNGNTVAVKYATNGGNLIKHEASVLNYLCRKSVKNIPHVIWYGMDLLPTTASRKLCIIMPKYDCSLAYYLSTFKTDKIIKLTETVVESIYILKSIHTQFIIHRDIKPDNLMVKDGIVSLIDFGFSQTIIDERGEHIGQTYSESIIGSPLFISPNIHTGSNPSRRDDLISLGYVFLKLFIGTLDWENIQPDDSCKITKETLLNNRHPTNRKMYNIKMDIDNVERGVIEFISNCGDDEKFKKILVSFIKYGYGLEYAEDPEYDVCIKDFYAVLG
jgi:casein kinase 1